MELADNTPSDAYPGVFAYARVFEGVHITVFCDRIAHALPGRENELLAHILAHEIAHLLQGIARHSESGVMKIRWSAADFREIRYKGLRFTPSDINLIHAGLAKRATLAARGR